MIWSAEARHPRSSTPGAAGPQWSAEINSDDQIVRVHHMASGEAQDGLSGLGYDLLSLVGIALCVAGLWLLAWVFSA